jgi:hypothetical protein
LDLVDEFYQIWAFLGGKLKSFDKLHADFARVCIFDHSFVAASDFDTCMECLRNRIVEVAGI